MRRVVTSNVDEEIVERLDNLVKNSDKFRNRSHFIEVAIREKLEKESKSA